MRPKINILLFLFLFCAHLLMAESDESDVRVFQPRYGSAESLYMTLQEMLTPQGRISFDRRSNQVVVKDTPENLQYLERIFSALSTDAQVEIYVRVIETTNEVLEELGLLAEAVVIPQSRIDAVLGFLTQENTTRFRTEMMVRTTSNYPASLNVTTDEIFGALAVTDSYGRTTASFYRNAVGNMLEALPVVHDDNTLTLTIQPASGRVDEYGSIKQRILRTTVRMNSGDTLVLGGQDSVYEQRYGRGSLQSQWGMRRARENIVVFLTARILQ